MSTSRDVAILVGCYLIGGMTAVLLLWAVAEPIAARAGWHDAKNPKLIQRALAR